MVRAFADRDHLDHHRGVGIDDGDDIGRPVTHIHGLTIRCEGKMRGGGAVDGGGTIERDAIERGHRIAFEVHRPYLFGCDCNIGKAPKAMDRS